MSWVQCVTKPHGLGNYVNISDYYVTGSKKLNSMGT